MQLLAYAVQLLTQAGCREACPRSVICAQTRHKGSCQQQVQISRLTNAFQWLIFISSRVSARQGYAALLSALLACISAINVCHVTEFMAEALKVHGDKGQQVLPVVVLL